MRRPYCAPVQHLFAHNSLEGFASSRCTSFCSSSRAGGGAEIAQNVDFTLTFFDACVIYSICKADLRQKMWS